MKRRYKTGEFLCETSIHSLKCIRLDLQNLCLGLEEEFCLHHVNVFCTNNWRTAHTNIRFGRRDMKSW